MPIKKKNKKHYINSDDFRDEILKSKKLEQLTPKAIEMLILMINEISKTYSYKNPMDREDCKAFAMEDVLRYWKGYNSEISKYAFAYFTRMIFNGLQKGWKKLHPIKTINMISISHENIYNI